MAAGKPRGKKAAANDDTPEPTPDHPGQTNFVPDDVDPDELKDAIDSLARLTAETKAIVSLIKVTTELSEQLRLLARLAQVSEKIRNRAAAIATGEGEE